MKFKKFQKVLNQNEINSINNIKTSMTKFIYKSRKQKVTFAQNNNNDNDKLNICFKHGRFNILKNILPNIELQNYHVVNISELSPFPDVNREFFNIKMNITKCFTNEFIAVGRHINQAYNVRIYLFIIQPCKKNINIILLLFSRQLIRKKLF